MIRHTLCASRMFERGLCPRKLRGRSGRGMCPLRVKARAPVLREEQYSEGVTVWG
jgi:hypothetical protein